MSGEEHGENTSFPTGVSGPAIILSVGLATLASGVAIYLLAALLLPPTAIENDLSFFVYSVLGQFLIAIGSLLVMGGLASFKVTLWPILLIVMIVAAFAAYGFHWPDWLLPPITSPFRPFIGQFTLAGLVFISFLVFLFSHHHRFWPMLWKPLLLAGVVVAVAIGLLAWLYSHIS